MRRALLWLFIVKDARDRWERSMKVAAQLLVFCLPLLAAALIRRRSPGLAACALMVGLGLVGFLFTTWYRWNVLEPRLTDARREARRAATRARRAPRTAFWRRLLEEKRVRENQKPRD